MATTRTTAKILGKRGKKCEKWIKENVREERIGRLVEEYWKQPIVLYTGAGVSAGPRKPINKKQYGLPQWLQLLQQVAGCRKTEKWPDDPWKAAKKAVDLCGGPEKFERKLEQFVGAPHQYRESYGQLNGTFVRNAPTLNAVAAFCGQITGRIYNPQTKKPSRVYYRTSANPRIRAVLTSNYDCFLESAASNLYRRSPLKPVTALGSVAGSMTRIPVFHIHGYVRHPFWGKDRAQTIDKLIITPEDYKNYWKPDDVFGTTMGPQIHYLRYFTVLFIGFSFNDEYVCNLLRRIHNDYVSHDVERTHFALLQDWHVQKKKASFFRNMGIEPIVYQEHDEIPSILGKVYKAGLATDRIVAGKNPVTKITLPELLVREHIPTQRNYDYPHDEIWEIMMDLRDEHVPASAVRDVEHLNDSREIGVTGGERHN